MLHALEGAPAPVNWEKPQPGSEARTILSTEATQRLTPLTGDMFPRDVIQLWFSLRRWRWSSLAVIPADAWSAAMPLADLISQVGTIQLGIPVDVVDARGVDLRNAPERIAQMRQKTSAGSLVLAAMSSVLQEPAGIPIASAADACLLFVTLGETDLNSGRRSIELVGRDRFIGCATARLPPTRIARQINRAEKAFFGRSS
jgi:hypothetical protein